MAIKWETRRGIKREEIGRSVGTAGEIMKQNRLHDNDYCKPNEKEKYKERQGPQLWPSHSHSNTWMRVGNRCQLFFRIFGPKRQM